MKKLLFITLFLATLMSCVPEDKKLLTEVNIDVDNPEIKRLFNYQNQQQLDSITAFLAHDDPSFRYLATQSFASYQNALALDEVYPKLDDPILKVRTAAAYTIGQIGKRRSQDSLIFSFKQKDTISVDNSFNSAILESIGKIGDESYLKLISTADSYRPTDSLLLLGQARAIYRYMLRGFITTEGTSKMVQLLGNQNIDDQTRLYAAHYLARAKDLEIDDFKFQINQIFSEEENVNIKMALALALGKINDKSITDNLIAQLDLSQDYRVICNVIRALNKDSYIQVAEKMLDLVKNENLHIARVAADFFKRNGNKDDASFYRDFANDSLHYLVKADMFAATFQNYPYYFGNSRNVTRNQIQKILEDEKDPLVIKAYLNALSLDPPSYNWIHENIFNAEMDSLKTACIQTYDKMLSNPDFNNYFKSSSNYVRGTILAFVKEAMSLENEGIIGAAADLIANEKNGMKALVDSTEFLSNTLEVLEMPQHIESINAVEKALGYLNNKPNVDLSKATSTKEIQWNLLNEFGKDVKALVKTSKGVFEIEFYLRQTPQSVLNFIQLSKQGFYNGQIFHRVVPNFVIQTGSPRGDNYGGENYVIRSELAQTYYDDEGYVGMASAGPHTESTQWFVTHSPTPHLDGKYTLFGKVVKGMDVVHEIQEGDQILEIIISKV